MVRCVLTVLSWYALLPWCHHGAAGQSNQRRQSFKNYWNTENGGYAAANNYTTSGDAMDVFRLPAGVSPVSYHLEVATDLERLSYAGRVTIVFKMSVSAVAANQIVLNSKDLRVTGVELVDRNTNKSNAVTQYYTVDKNEQLVIELNCSTVRCLVPNRLYAVDVAFEAPLRNDMSGYYKSSYKGNNVTKYTFVYVFTIS